MPDRMRQAVAPAYLLMCLALGGSVQGIWTNALLQLTGVAIIVWAVLSPAEAPLDRRGRQLLWVALAMLAVVIIQLVPLPASLWPHLGGREEIAADYRLLGMQVPALSLSITPYETLATIFRAIPPVAIFCAMIRARAYRGTWFALALITGTMAAILLGVLQVSSDPVTSQWYFYPQSSRGQAVGFFANANHMGDLLVVTLPFLAALLLTARGRTAQQFSGIATAVAGAVLVVLVGIVLNRSGAAYVLALPVAIVSLVLVLGRRRRIGGWAVALAVVLTVVGGALVLGPAGDRLLGSSVSVSSRAEMASNTVRATKDFAPFGSGLGSFRAVYPLYESPDEIDRVVTTHAHNDYLELALETGLPGILIMLAFLIWWAVAASSVWRSSASSPYARAAVIASAAILFHSLVDFPLRTAALGAVFAMCLGLMCARPRTQKADESELWPTRHMGLD